VIDRANDNPVCLHFVVDAVWKSYATERADSAPDFRKSLRMFSGFSNYSMNRIEKWVPQIHRPAVIPVPPYGSPGEVVIAHHRFLSSLTA
jgi:hypothetical protein